MNAIGAVASSRRRTVLGGRSRGRSGLRDLPPAERRGRTGRHVNRRCEAGLPRRDRRRRGAHRAVEGRLGAQRAGRNGRLGVTRQWRDDRRRGLPARRRARLEVSRRLRGSAWSQVSRSPSSTTAVSRRWPSARRISTSPPHSSSSTRSERATLCAACPPRRRSSPRQRSAVTSARARLARAAQPTAARGRRCSTSRHQTRTGRARDSHGRRAGGTDGHDPDRRAQRAPRTEPPRPDPPAVEPGGREARRVGLQEGRVRAGPTPTTAATPSPEAILAAQIAINNARATSRGRSEPPISS